MWTWSLLGAVLVVGAGAAPTAAQDWRTYATVQHPDRFAINWRAFYEKATELTDAARRTLPHSLDLAYGADPKQRLDLYFPAETPRQAPVFLFIHGGGFREGDRRQYGYVAAPLAARGIITAVMSYRLVPHVYPSQVDGRRTRCRVAGEKHRQPRRRSSSHLRRWPFRRRHLLGAPRRPLRLAGARAACRRTSSKGSCR